MLVLLLDPVQVARHSRHRPRFLVPRAHVAGSQQTRQLVPIFAAVAAHHWTAHVQGNLKRMGMLEWRLTSESRSYVVSYRAVLLFVEALLAVAEHVVPNAVFA